MIPEPISFTGRLELQDLLDIHRYHSRVVMRGSIRALASVFSLFFAGLVIAAWILGGFKPVMLALLIFCAYFPFGWWITDRIAVRRRHARQPDKQIETTVKFTNDSISCANVRGDARLNWNLIFAVLDTPRGLLFLLPDNIIWFWLPQRLFQENLLREGILNLAAEHSIEIRKIG